jgi:hypothetical protein
MVTALAFVAVAVSSLFAEATLVRWLQRRASHLAAWTVALGLFALASAVLALGTSNGWDTASFRAFFLFGGVLNVPWLGLGTVALLWGPDTARKVRWFVVFFSGLAAGVVLSAPMDHVHGTEIPVGKEVFDAFPRVLAAIGSGAAAIVIFAGALLSAWRYARDRHDGRLAAANGLIALGTLVLSGGGVLQGAVGHDEAFAITLATGITIIYAGFLAAEGTHSRSSRRRSLPDGARGK